MDTPQRTRRPGDVFLDRHMPEASEAEREEARDNLRSYAAVVLRIATRLATEEYAQAIRADGSDAVALKSGATPHL